MPSPPTKEDMEWADILTVDLSLYDTQKEELIKTVATALQRDGFFYVVGHGIDHETLSRQFDLGQLAFDGVDQEEKETHRAPIKEKGSFIGYKLQNFWEIKDGIRDRIEHYNFYQNSIDPISRHPKPLQPYVDEVKAFLAETRQKVLQRVSNLIDGVLGLEEGHIWRLHETAEGRTGDDLLRYMIYDPLTSEEASKTNGVMLNGHTDFNSISCLISQPITALQVLMPDNAWRYVKHRDDAYVINIGDQLSFMSGGILKGTMHRVVCPPKDQLHLRRLGVFHFAHFIHDVPLELFDSEKVRKEGHKIFEGNPPTTTEWEVARIKSYGTGNFIRGEEYDTEILNGIHLRHYH
ncbi:hypothetical protein BDQ12DRAFT_640141 [Crucibulum laeve]|uniref:Clavaminate synthase-like protein n=1 Tax=Crucibulum laeve TaxID=68775 RepID=A0A5C3LET7_9AGAR|nr:hypothetical protein BDQ12DRAFT_640141 [Crucibulum laeve]